MTVQKDASLHETAVQKVATGDVAFPQQPKPRAQARRLATTTRNERVKDVLMRAARTAAHGDMRRLIIINENEVVVLNHRRSK